MNYLENKNIPESERRDIAFQSVVAVREAVSMANKSGQPITYKTSINIISELDLEYHSSLIKLVLDKNESELVRFYREKAESQSTLEKIVTPEEIINKEIKEMQADLDRNRDKKFPRLIKQKIALEKALLNFVPTRLSEHKLIETDYFLAERDSFFINKVYEGIKFKDYQITKNRILRMRLLHPDHEETVTGADLIYEQYNLKTKKVRIISLQYKAWDTKRIYIDDRSKKQVVKLESNYCNTGLCHGYDGQKHPINYRFPYCATFLRPTSRLYNQESKLVTTGIHIPICEIQKLLSKSNSFTKDDAYNKNISHSMFDELFNNNMIGSKWINIVDLEKFYQKLNFESNLDKIKIYAQEFNEIVEEEGVAELY